MKEIYTHIIQNSSRTDRFADFCLQPLHHLLRTVDGKNVKIYREEMGNVTELPYKHTTNKVIHWGLTIAFFIPGTVVGTVLKGIAHLDPGLKIRLERVKGVASRFLEEKGLNFDCALEIYKQLPPMDLIRLSQVQLDLFHFIHNDSEEMQVWIKEYLAIHLPYPPPVLHGNHSLYSILKKQFEPIDFDQTVINKYFTNREDYFKLPLYIYTGKERGIAALADTGFEIRKKYENIYDAPLVFRVRHLDDKGNETESIGIEYSQNGYPSKFKTYVFCYFDTEKFSGWQFVDFYPFRDLTCAGIVATYSSSLADYPLPIKLVRLASTHLGRHFYRI